MAITKKFSFGSTCEGLTYEMCVFAVFTRSESHSSFMRFMIGNDPLKTEEVC